MVSCWVPLPVMWAVPPLPGTKADSSPEVSVRTTVIVSPGGLKASGSFTLI